MYRLTLTWDVLKCNCKTGATYNDNGLTLTWDVLKLYYSLSVQ